MQLETSRRTFLKGSTLSGIAESLDIWSFNARSTLSLPPAASLQGASFDLTIGEAAVNITGSERQTKTINGELPGPTLRWKEDDTITFRVKNHLDEQTSIHWHGIILPANMDGVPGLNFTSVKPDDTHVYTFRARQNGTYWYHSHSGFREQEGVCGTIIIDAREPEPFAYDRGYMMMLSDRMGENPHSLLKKLKKQSDYYDFSKPTVGSFFRDASAKGLSTTIANQRVWVEVKINPTDLADVSGHTYTYPMNGQASLRNWAGLFRPGEKIRLRFINGSAMTYSGTRIPGLKVMVVAANGQYVNPVIMGKFRIAVVETYGVIVEPQDEAYTIFTQSMGRAGYARGTLATRGGVSATVLALNPRPLLTMDDMGMGGTSHDVSGMDHGQMAGMDSSGKMMSMDGSGVPNSTAPSMPVDYGGMAGMDHSLMTGIPRMQSHPASKTNNLLVDMRAMSVSPKLSDPDIGLHNNGRKVLTYADLRSRFEDPDRKEPGHTIELHLTGHMEKLVWSFNGIKFSNAAPMMLKYGERLRITLVDDTMVTHPIHLHGMWSGLEGENGNFIVRKHTIDVPPGTKRSCRVTIDALGRWTYHYYLLYHVEMGMFRRVRVEE